MRRPNNHRITGVICNLNGADSCGQITLWPRLLWKSIICRETESHAGMIHAHVFSSGPRSLIRADTRFALLSLWLLKSWRTERTEQLRNLKIGFCYFQKRYLKASFEK